MRITQQIKKNPAYTTINCLYCIGLQFQSLMRHFRFGGIFSLVSKTTINQSISRVALRFQPTSFLSVGTERVK